MCIRDSHDPIHLVERQEKLEHSSERCAAVQTHEGLAAAAEA